MSKQFTLTEEDKALVISDGSHYHLEVRIDYDDVDHQQIMREAKRLLKLMNDNAEKLTYENS